MNASVPANDAAWLSRTRTFLLLGLLVFLLFGVLIRARIQLGSTLPPSSPWQWHLVGLAEDAFSAGLLALVLMIFARGPRRAAAIRRLFGLLVVVLSVLHLIKSEAVLHFGTAIRPEHFQLGPVFTTMQRSIRDYSGLLLIGSVAAVSVSLWLASHIARNVRRLAVTIPGMLVLVVASAAIVLTPWEVHRREMIRSPLLALVDVILGQRSSRGSSVQAAPAMSSREVSQVRELAGSPRSFLTPEYPLAYRPPARDPAAPKSPPGLRPNVVFIALENLRTEEVGAYGARVKGVTPHLDRLAAEGIRFEHAYSGGSYTTTAEAGLWYGIPGLPGLGLVRDNAEIRLTGLPEILRTAGWRSFFWISSTDQNFFKRSEFYEPRGFQMFDGNDFPKSDPRVNWGVSDRALARRSVEALNRLREPFAAMILTVNNHHPYQLPSDAGPLLGGLPAERRGFAKFGDKGQLLGLHSSQMIQTIHYSDQAVGDFFEASARQPWFSRTIFVITGDHGNPVVPLGRQVETTHELSDLSYRVPLILYSPLLQGGTMVHSPASHADLLPTILGFAGVDSARSGIGTDLLGGTLDPDRPVFTWNAADLLLRITTARFVYYATIPASGLPDSGPYPDELLIDPVRDPSGRQNISAQNPAAVERFRRLARIYAEVYPRLVRAGRSGLPPGAAGSSDDS